MKSFYKKKKYPHDVGLIESSIIIRKNGNHIVDETMKMWFDLLIKFTMRDQLTFNYCVYETNMPVSYIDLNLWDNEYQKNFRQYYFSLEDIENKEKYIHDREKYIIGLDQELLKKETEIKESNKKIEEQKKIIFEKDKVI